LNSLLRAISAIDPVAVERELQNQQRLGNCTNPGDELKDASMDRSAIPFTAYRS
jgi:hypothetical protein